MAQAIQPAQQRVTSVDRGVARFIDSQNQWSLAWRRFKRNKAALVGLVIIAFYVLVAVFAPVLAPHNPVKDNSGMQYIPPFWRAESPAGVAANPTFPLGTDSQGRDVLSRVIYGTRSSIVAGLLPVIFILLIGCVLGFISGWKGGFLDNLLMRVTDIFFAFPDVLFLILVMVTMGDSELGKAANGLPLFLVALAIVSWAGLARLMRGSALALKDREFVDASRSMGASTNHIIGKHILPNSLGLIVVWAAFAIPRLIIAEAILGYLGLGLRPSITGKEFFVTSWGRLFLEGYANVASQPDYLLFLSIVVSVLVIAFTFVGDGLRDALDPRMKK
jgi:oligopeptide transport system permease protein